jgi:hypothetical protein
MKNGNNLKVGDVIMHNNGYFGPYLITNIDEHGYELDGSGFRTANIENYHKVEQ